MRTKEKIKDLEEPEEECDDKKCPFHGEIDVKPEEKKGELVSKDLNKTAKIKWDRKYEVPKYERYEIRSSSIKAHNPPCIDAEKGQIVKAMRTKPLSKTKDFVIVEVVEDETS